MRPSALTVVAVVGAALLSGLLSGCRVDTRVSVVDQAGGGGSLAVTVTLDQAAVKALGGQTALARQLQYADLEAAGWQVSGPSLMAGGAAAVTVTHRFSDTRQLSRLMAEVAGNGPPGSSGAPFSLRIAHGGDFWTDRTVVRGRVDLTCGLECFGDPGLQAALGGSLGVAPAPLEGEAGEKASQVFHFSLALHLAGHPGSLSGSPSVSRDGTLTWSPALGSSVSVGAVSESVDWGHVILVAVPAGLILLGGGGGLLWRRRRRRRRGGAEVPGEGDAASPTPGETVASVPGDPTSWPTV